MTNYPSSIIPDKRPAVWFYHFINLNSLTIFFFIFFIALVEVKFDFIEKMTGDFLRWNNTKREKLGRVWNVEQQSIAAMGHLNELLIEKEEKQKKVETIDHFSDLFVFFKTDRLISLSNEQFLKIYKNLPSNLSDKIIAPYDLLNYFHRSNWEKTFLFQKETGVEIVLVDDQYGVLKSILISKKDANYLSNFGRTVFASLEKLEEFSNRIYDVNEFMDALYKMKQGDRYKIIYNPFVFLSWGSDLKRIAISDISEDNLVQVGFEIHSSNKKKVVIIYVDDFLISNLIQILAGEVETTPVENALRDDKSELDLLFDEIDN